MQLCESVADADGVDDSSLDHGTVTVLDTGIL